MKQLLMTVAAFALLTTGAHAYEVTCNAPRVLYGDDPAITIRWSVSMSATCRQSTVAHLPQHRRWSRGVALGTVCHHRCLDR